MADFPILSDAFPPKPATVIWCEGSSLRERNHHEPIHLHAEDSTICERCNSTSITAWTDSDTIWERSKSRCTPPRPLSLTLRRI